MTLLKVNQPKRYLNGWMDELLNDFPTAFGKTFTEASFSPQVNIKETNEAYKLSLLAPGRNKEDFKINIEKNLLTVSSEKKEEEVQENENHIRKEFNLQSFKRTFTLDEKIEADKIEAKYENGVLILNLPKKEDVKIAAKEISVQ
ncbi:MAG: Hsp20/alpha crystallin family protein [Ginsengibacter sp.]